MMRNSLKPTLALAALTAFNIQAEQASAQDFTIQPGQTVGQQNLNTVGDDGLVLGGGTVLTSNNGEDAVVMLNNSQTLNVSAGGAVETHGSTVFNIFSQGDDVTINTAGLITATGNDAAGIASTGLDAIINNSGSILMSGAGSTFGIAASGDNATIRNSGSIETMAPAGIGILANGAQAYISNTGTIASNNTAGFGIISDGPDATILNSGTISATGTAGTAVIANGDRAYVQNSGALMSDIASTAVIMSGDNAVLELLAGSRIQGDMMFTGTNGLLDVGPGLNTALTFIAPPAFLNTSGAPFVVSGNLLAVVDTTNLEMEQAAILDTGNVIANEVDAHLHVGHDHRYWLRTAGNFSSADAQQTGVAYDNGAGILLAGADVVTKPDFYAGLFAGFSAGESASAHNSQKLGHAGVYGGGYLQMRRKASFVDVAATAGAVQFESERAVANNLVLGGMEIARADYDALVFSPSVTIGHDMQFQSVRVTPSLRARYSHIALDGYVETGSAANLAMSSRSGDTVDGRAQLSFQLPAVHMGEHLMDVDFRIGADASWHSTGAATTSVLGQQLSLADSGSRTSLHAFAGMGVDYQVSRTAILRASGEAALATNGDFAAQALLSLTIGDRTNQPNDPVVE